MAKMHPNNFLGTRLLIIEDDSSLNQLLTLHFEDRGFIVSGAGSCRQATEIISTQQGFDLALLDQQLPDGMGIDFLETCLAQIPDVIMMTGQHDLELAIQAIKKGAGDFVHKPVKAQDLDQAINKVLARRQAIINAGQQGASNRGAEDKPARVAKELIGRSNAMLEVSKQIALSAENMATVLIQGESGTGKEIVARLIHQYSGRKGQFIPINCAALVDTLLESELFGHEKGAFTGASHQKPGKFELAENGTLFLDEIAELAPQLQAKLLRALQEKVVERVGGTSSIPVNARIIAATHQDLLAPSGEHGFREDLAYRLKVIQIQLPPLRARKEDIPLLTAALLDKMARSAGRVTPPVTEDTVKQLIQYDWPGNVRELENVLTQAMIRARDGAITPDLLQLQQRHESDQASEAKPSPSAIPETLDQVEARHIQLVLDHTGGHKGNSCKILGISRPALDRKIEKFRLRLPM